MARIAKEEISFGGASFTVETLTCGELGQILPLYRRYFEIIGQGGLLAEGGVETAIGIIAGGLKKDPVEVAKMPADMGEIAEAIIAIGRVCGLEFDAPGEAAAGAGTVDGISAPSMPPSPPAAATATPTSIE